MTAYYNEIDPYAAQWLRNLIDAGRIAKGDVDERSIVDVRPDDLAGYTQCHFFAGIGVWSYAFRQAGWPDDRTVWTGSCPCQPFSAAGRKVGVADERHLWPAFFHLINQCKPASVFGEQVASKDGLAWFDAVQTDLEDAGYAVGAADLCAAGLGAPHIRQRLFFGASRVEYTGHNRPQGRVPGRSGQERQTIDGSIGHYSTTGGMADADQQQLDRPGCIGAGRRNEPANCGSTERLGGPDDTGPIRGPNPTNGFWRDADWLGCRDGKLRPVEPRTFPLAHGSPARVGRLRAYGNAIVPQVAATFIEAFMESVP